MKIIHLRSEICDTFTLCLTKVVRNVMIFKMLI